MSDTQVFLIDHHPVALLGTSHLLTTKGVAVCGTASDLAGFAGHPGRAQATALILDRYPRPNTKARTDFPTIAAATLVLIYSDEGAPELVEAAFLEGARGYVSKSESADCLLHALQTVLDGDLYLSPSLAQAYALSRIFCRKFLHELDLSQREAQIFKLLGQGHSMTHIGDQLCISPKTVGTYCRRLKRKFGFSTTSELIREAVARKPVLAATG